MVARKRRSGTITPPVCTTGSVKAIPIECLILCFDFVNTRKCIESQYNTQYINSLQFWNKLHYSKASEIFQTNDTFYAPLFHRLPATSDAQTVTYHTPQWFIAVIRWVREYICTFFHNHLKYHHHHRQTSLHWI